MDWTYPVAAVITAVPATIAAGAAWHKAYKTKKSLGESNGRGDAIKMLTDLQDSVQDVSVHILEIKQWQIQHLDTHIRTML